MSLQWILNSPIIYCTFLYRPFHNSPQSFSVHGLWLTVGNYEMACNLRQKTDLQVEISGKKFLQILQFLYRPFHNSPQLFSVHCALAPPNGKAPSLYENVRNILFNWRETFFTDVLFVDSSERCFEEFFVLSVLWFLILQFTMSRT